MREKYVSDYAQSLDRTFFAPAQRCEPGNVTGLTGVRVGAGTARVRAARVRVVCSVSNLVGRSYLMFRTPPKAYGLASPSPKRTLHVALTHWAAGLVWSWLRSEDPGLTTEIGGGVSGARSFATSFPQGTFALNWAANRICWVVQSRVLTAASTVQRCDWKSAYLQLMLCSMKFFSPLLALLFLGCLVSRRET